MARLQPYGPKRLAGQALADAYAASFSYLAGDGGKVWASYEGGGWIVLRGECKTVHPNLREQYPNGWSLFNRVRSSAARKRLHEMTRN